MDFNKIKKEQKIFIQKLRDLANEYIIFCETELEEIPRKEKFKILDKQWVDFALNWNLSSHTESPLNILSFENLVNDIINNDGTKKKT